MPENNYNLSFDEQIAASRDLGREKRKAEEIAEPDQADTADDGSYAAWRRRAVAMRRMMLDKKMSQNNQAAAAGTPVRLASSNLLRAAWLALIPSWGLSLIWIDIHAFLRIVFPSFFCKLGEEWLPRQVVKRTGSAGNTAVSGAFAVESMALVFMNLIMLSTIAFVFTVIYVVVNFNWYNWLMLAAKTVLK